MYVDDILVHTPARESHLKVLEALHEVLMKAQVKLNPK